MPDVGAIVGVGVALLRPQSRFEVGALLWPPQEKRLDDGVGGRFRMLGGHADACLAPGWPTLRVPVCVGIELASMHGRGIGVDEPEIDRRLWAAVRVHQRLVWLPHRRVGLFLQPAVAIAFLRPGFEVDDGRVVHRAQRAEIRSLAGVELRLP
jgi:hypothetical protein